ncbi:Hsp33 family molecular chaperone HslO [Clostridium sp. D2Q-14]|uniref:Hsp33 family molecular chaperone HslO n=1 Tax=Anaeromonas gelatinilytica TaxID=2683194 RepID=UPI00193BBC2A|nr:Hsp33 family molecular chaperone HslO [Anaeromonas gelatinilytica]MBS4534177.1 Hsp33 family molecular chaperone HslO [Anaeromonas gelatinilytica]
MKDYVIRAMDEDKSFRVFIASSTHMVDNARIIHNTSPVATAAIGRTITAAAMMGLMFKGDKDKISLQIRGNGSINNILAVANNKGEVKGFISNPNIDLPNREDGKLNVGGAVGNKGKIIVIRDMGLKDPYVGQTNLVSGEIAEDLANYFTTSEQQPSAVALGVLVDKDISVKASGGVIVQVLPNIEKEILKKLEKNINMLSSISSLIDRGFTPEEILNQVFGEFNMKITEKNEIKFSCDCNRDRMERGLMSLGKKEISEILDEDGKAELVCHFCNKKYIFNENDLRDIINSI